jgi:hypothetical protein
MVVLKKLFLYGLEGCFYVGYCYRVASQDAFSESCSCFYAVLVVFGVAPGLHCYVSAYERFYSQTDAKKPKNKNNYCPQTQTKNQKF